MTPLQVATPEAFRLRVLPARGGWRVTGDAAETGVFPDQREATAFACDLARARALTGRVAMVVVQAEPEEMHGFFPGQGAYEAARRPRLVDG